jgi:hypothetical protein
MQEETKRFHCLEILDGHRSLYEHRWIIFYSYKKQANPVLISIRLIRIIR